MFSDHKTYVLDRTRTRKKDRKRSCAFKHKDESGDEFQDEAATSLPVESIQSSAADISVLVSATKDRKVGVGKSRLENENKSRKTSLRRGGTRKASPVIESSESEEEESPSAANESPKEKRMVASRTARKRKMKHNLQQPRTQKRAKQKDDDSFIKKSSEEGESAASLSEAEELNFKTPPRRKRPSRTRSSRVLEDSADDIESSEDDGGTNGHGSRSRSTRHSSRKSAKKKVVYRDHSSSEIEEEETVRDTANSTKPQRAGRGRRRRRTNAGRHRDSDESDDKDEHDAASPRARRNTPSRAARRAVAKLSTFQAKSSDDDDDSALLPKFFRQRDDEDESYAESVSHSKAHDSTSDDEAMQEDHEEDFLSQSDVEGTVKPTNIDNDNLFDADESSGDEKPKALSFSSPQLEIRPTPKQDSDDESNSAKEDDVFRSPVASPYKSQCGSTTDAITMEALPMRHVCFFPPDNTSCQCFALSTMHKIALSGTRIYDGEGKVTFKQPPHFREKASDDLLDQIASRFGRGALDVFGTFYNPRNDSVTVNPYGSNEFSYMGDYDGTFANSERFLEQVNNYVNQYMGSKDLYCCPLCYSEAHRRIENKRDGAEDPAETDTSLHEGDFPRNDPLEVIGYIDDDAFHLASSFCFRKQVQLKRHLQYDHGINLKTLDGVDLYKRFMIRQSDGLLQRYLERQYHGRVKQGYMARYWNLGNNEIFVYLLNLVERSQRLRELVKTIVNDDTEEPTEELIEATRFVEEVAEFQSSFTERVTDWWEAISAPYSKESKAESMEQFVDDNSEDAEGDVPHHLLHRAIFGSNDMSVNPADEIVSVLKARRLNAHDSSSASAEDASEVEGASGEEDDDKIINYDGYYSEEQSEDDEWVRQRTQRPKHALKAPAANHNDKKTHDQSAVRKRLGKARKGSLEQSTPIQLPTQALRSVTPRTVSSQKNKKKQTKVIFEESDDDEFGGNK